MQNEKKEETGVLRFDPNLRWLFTEYPMAERYRMAAQAGFKGVEVAFPYDVPAAQLARMLTDLDLKLVQVLSPFDWEGGERGLAALEGRESAFRSSIETAIEYGAQVGKPLIHVMPGNIGPEMNRDACLARFKENIAWAADKAAAAGMTLILEPCCAARFPQFLYHRLGEGAEVIREIGRDNVKLCFDTFHVQMEEGNITAHLQEYFPYIGHMQVGNVPGRHEPGTGEIHFPWIFAEIEKLDWQGWIGCEYMPSAHTLDTLGWGQAYGIKGRR